VFVVSRKGSNEIGDFAYKLLSDELDKPLVFFLRGGHRVVCCSMKGDYYNPGSVEALSFTVGDRQVVIGVASLKGGEESERVFKNILGSLVITGPGTGHMFWTTGE